MTQSDDRRKDLIWHLTGRAITGLAGLGIATAIGVGGWSLKMQLETGEQLNELSTTIRILAIEVTNGEKRWTEQQARQIERDKVYEHRLGILEQFGPGSGPRVTPDALDSKIADAVESTNRILDRLTITIQNQTVLLARLDERVNQLEKNQK